MLFKPFLFIFYFSSFSDLISSNCENKMNEFLEAIYGAEKTKNYS